MSKIEFTCGVCKAEGGKSFIGTATTKWKCPTHRDVCDHCKTGGVSSAAKCKKCDSVLTRYSYNKIYEKWMQV
jgi:uncharacterized paraquat-inducible protein A